MKSMSRICPDVGRIVYSHYEVKEFSLLYYLNIADNENGGGCTISQKVNKIQKETTHAHQ